MLRLRGPRRSLPSTDRWAGCPDRRLLASLRSANPRLETVANRRAQGECAGSKVGRVLFRSTTFPLHLWRRRRSIEKARNRWTGRCDDGAGPRMTSNRCSLRSRKPEPGRMTRCRCRLSYAPQRRGFSINQVQNGGIVCLELDVFRRPSFPWFWSILYCQTSRPGSPPACSVDDWPSGFGTRTITIAFIPKRRAGRDAPVN